MATSGRDRKAKRGRGGQGKREQGERRWEESSRLGWIRNSSNQGEIVKLFLATRFGNKELVAG